MDGDQPKAVNYRHVNPNEVAADVMKQRSLDAEKKAYGTRVQLEHLKPLSEAEPWNQTLATLVKNFETELPKIERQAARAFGAAPINDEEKAAVHMQFLNEWMAEVEKQMATQAALSAEADRQLALEENALEDEERTQMMSEREMILREHATLHKAHIYIAEHINSIPTFNHN